jgi:AcrR family transcriptional regulator
MMAAVKDKMKWRQEGVQNPLDVNPELFEATLAVFSTQSFGEASLNDIIKTAGLNKGSFYYRFYDKLDLYLSLIYKLGMEKLTVFKQYDINNSGSDFFESIKKKALLGLRFARHEPRYYSFLRRLLSEDTQVRNAVRECFGDMTQNVLEDMVEDGKAKGQLRKDISTRMAAAVFSTILDQVDLMISPAMDDEDILAQLDELIMILKGGMAGSY